MASHLKGRLAFTLIEVLISIVLVGIILPPLYKLITLMQSSNSQIFTYVQKQKQESKAINTLYLDILSSDGNITIKKDEFTRLCMENTNNSLYGLTQAKVCWVVLKENNTLVRVEGNNYRLPLGLEDKVEVDMAMKNLDLFDVYRSKDGVLVLAQESGKKPVSFALYGIYKPQKKKPKKKKQRARKPRKSKKPNKPNSPRQR